MSKFWRQVLHKAHDDGLHVLKQRMRVRQNAMYFRGGERT